MRYVKQLTLATAILSGGLLYNLPSFSANQELATQTVQKTQQTPEWLFVVQAGNASIKHIGKNVSLTLTDVPDHALAFTDRPFRYEHKIDITEITQFINNADQKENNDVNVVLVGYDDNNLVHNVPLTFTKMTMNSSNADITAIYLGTDVEINISDLKDVSLFIDNYPVPMGGG